MPGYSVNAAPAMVSVKMNPIPPPGHDVCAWSTGRILSISHRPTVSVIPTNSTTSTMVCFTPSATLPPAGGCSIPSTKENKIHPTRSLNIADEMITVPISVRRRFTSIRILAISCRQKARPKGKRHTEYAHQQRALALAEDAAQVDLKPGRQQEEHNSQRGDRVEHDRHRPGCGKQGLVEARLVVAQDSRSQKDSDRDFPENRRLADLLHQLGRKFGASQQRGQRHEHGHHVVRIQVRHS